MSHKSTQARQKATAQAKLSVRTKMAIQARPQVPKGQSHKGEVSKVRGGVLTTWLIFVLVVNTLAVCLSLIWFIMNPQPSSSSWSGIAALIICTLAVISTIGIFKWKKWGFYLFLVTACCSFMLDIVLGQVVVVSHSVSQTSMYTTHVYITWPLAACLMWILVHSKKRWPMFS
jgi:hypothetical protein